jgi:UDP-glucose 4-epimerase
MKVVVTGASGFLGRVVVARLTRAGIDTLAVSRRAVPGALTVGDYADTPHGDVLVHLAQDSNRGAVNAQGEAGERDALRQMQALLAKNYSCVIYGSSAAVYGDQLARPCRLSDPSLAVDPYTRIKSQCEALTLSQSSGAVLRLANLYGRGMSEANVLSAVLRALPQPGPVALHDLAPVRDFIAVRDAADAVVVLVGGRQRGLFNIGSGRGASVGEVARLLLDLAGQPSREVVATRPSGRFSSIVLDLEETANHLAWRPRVALADGLRELLDFNRIGNS